MWRDPIVEEIHRVRDEQAKKFGYDLHAICEDIRERQATSERKLVTRSPRKPAVNDAA
jgi:hypothetical protein